MSTSAIDRRVQAGHSTPGEVPRADRLAHHREHALPPLAPRWRRVWKDRRLMHHNRLAALVLVINAAVAWQAWRQESTSVATWWSLATNAVLVNFALTVLIRQQRVINLLFAAATAAPRSWPLRVRWTLGKVYHFGGLHVGGALATTAWFAVGVAALMRGAGPSGSVRWVLLTLDWILLVLLLGMLATAVPRFRARFHDRFELVHRFAGWAALALFGTHAAVAAVAERGLSWRLIESPALWVFAVAVVSVASTWWDLRRVPVRYERPSRHVVLAHFEHRTPFAGSSTALSRSPLRQWHHFANVPAPGQDGFRLTISRAGDWTGDLIDDLPETVWVKGIPTAGVGNIDRLFTRVLWVATGSGIGPCLPHLLAADTPADLVWSTRTPRATYGDDLVEEILSAQPEAVIWDTTLNGKPDLVRLALAAFDGTGAEAVICISNKPTTWSIVEAFERRGIPAYGAIWDS